ncbi:hypothetical protein [Sporohalobacter salinus]|uniref:hypothetical protein n=1 Tax=Sporohalobacter salinus TaxID=1494606 RepID=UPI001960E7C8|nr:hypothetical protein [Sporohalobacter salinus]MBM7622790.1 anion-transporting ArsA/GET3 family ATPase [Sporohalobacter salinus]
MIADKRIDIFTGHYGSGKTEIAINYALKLAEEYERVKIIDLDTVNPYFRSREAKEPLEKAGVEVLAPVGRLAQTDLPALSPEILGAIQDQKSQVVFDVGGDKEGTIALGRFRKYLEAAEVDLNFVVNLNRPSTSDSQGVTEAIDRIEQASRLEIDYLISNPNLGNETEAKHVIRGHKELQKTADKLEIPIKFLVKSSEFVERLNEDEFELPVLDIEIFMRAPWNNYDVFK